MGPARRRTRALFLLISLGISFLVLEAFARLLLRRRETIFAVGSRQGGCVWDLDESGWRLYWIARHARDGDPLIYRRDVYDPELGWRPKPRLREDQDFPPANRGGTRLTTNSRGFRGRAEVADAKDPARVRVVTLGDSFTFGDEVGDQGTYPYFTQQLLPAAEVINLGVHAYGHDQMLLYWQRAGRRLKPDVVVLGFVSEDLLRNQLAFRDFAKPKFELAGGRLVLTHSPVPAPEAVLAGEWRRPKAIDLLRMIGFRLRYLRDPSLPDHFDALSARILEELARSIRDAGARPIFVHIPEPCHLVGPQADAAALARSERAFSDFCAASGTECLSASEELRRETAGWTEAITTWGHWDARGNAAIARALAARLRSEAPSGTTAP